VGSAGIVTYASREAADASTRPQLILLTSSSPLAFTVSDSRTAASNLVVSAVSSAPPTLNVANLGGGQLQFSWTGGGTLQAQTNSLSVGLGTNWVDYPGASPVTITIDSANGSVFYRVKQ
jgi:hypothetical protein